jgi:(2Fe-2S) ferredoxin
VTAYPPDELAAAGCIIRVCRDCCCGTERKHPGVDHDSLLARLEAGTRGAARVLRSACLLACDASNVLVVTPSRQGRRSGGRPVWVGGVLDDEAVDDVVAWVRSGGPGVAPLPPRLQGRVFPPSGLSLTYAHVD